MERPVKIYKMGELFSGPGGLAVGAMSACPANAPGRIAHAWAVDYDPDSCETYRNNICPENPGSVYCADVTAPEFSEKVIPQLGGIDGFAFGFPCNDFSKVGRQKGICGKFGRLYAYGIDILKKFRPEWFVAENVSGLQASDGGTAFRQILGEMEGAGYRLTPHLYKFEEYGIPQARHRIIVVGIRGDVQIDGMPVQYQVPKPSMNIRSCREALSGIAEDAPNHEKPRHAPRVIQRLQYIRPGRNAFEEESSMPEELRLQIGGARLSQIYRRLDPDKPAYTVTGSGGGGTHMYHWEEARALTNRERARLQTFEDDYVFSGGVQSVRRQIGMAVPCEGSRLIFEALLRSLAGVKYESVEASYSTREASGQITWDVEPRN